MSHEMLKHDRPGVALVLVLLILLAVGALSTAASLVTSNAVMISTYDERQSVLEAAVDAGLQEGRAMLNADPDLFPDTGYTLLKTGTVRNAEGDVIPGIRRWIYAGPTGSTTGQYGVFGSVVAVAEDGSGDRVVRRLEIVQESFAKYAYFTDFEPSDIKFGNGDQIFGPVHSNSDIKIYASGATFHGPVTTAGRIRAENPGTAIFVQGYEERVPEIQMPETANLNELEGFATDANMVFTSSFRSDASEAPLRIEFTARDLNGDGDVTDANEGFIRVFRVRDPDDAWYVVAGRPPTYNQGWPRDYMLTRSPNCGHVGTHGVFKTAAAHDPPDPGYNYHPGDGDDPNDNAVASLRSGGRCYLGGANELFGEFQDTTRNGMQETRTGRHIDGGDEIPDGNWVPWPGTVPAVVVAAGAEAPDSLYLFPITRQLNPEFKGVIYVDGDVAISGVLRGHVTLAATGDIIIADDLTYATLPGSADRNCTDDDDANDDMLGLFAGGDVVIADNLINAPAVPWGNGNSYRSFDDTPEEILHGTVLTLNIFTVDNYDSGARDAEACGSTEWGRGCLFLTGGIIQRQRGAVGTTAGTGNVKRYSYDECAALSPPPYFPTTGYFRRGRFFEVNPVGFDVAEYFALLRGDV
ncbi:MAG TPA: hypothetical protein VF188_12705 [Longimicrobiales bacterium]